MDGVVSRRRESVAGIARVRCWIKIEIPPRNVSKSILSYRGMGEENLR